MAKKKKKPIAVPKSIEQASEFMTHIGKYQRALTQMEIDLTHQIEELKTRALKASSGHREAIEQLFESIYIFAEKNRDKLTERGRKKTFYLQTGKIFWHMSPPKVSFRRGWNNDRVVELCKSLGLRRFIRTKKEVDKEAMLKEPKVANDLQGVKIGQKELFVVKPYDTVEIVRDIKKLQKVLPKK